MQIWLVIFIFIHFYKGSKSTIINKPAMTDDPQRRKPDITTAKRELGWEPKVWSLHGHVNISSRIQKRLQNMKRWYYSKTQYLQKSSYTYIQEYNVQWKSFMTIQDMNMFLARSGSKWVELLLMYIKRKPAHNILYYLRLQKIDV